MRLHAETGGNSYQSLPFKFEKAQTRLVKFGKEHGANAEANDDDRMLE